MATENRETMTAGILDFSEKGVAGQFGSDIEDAASAWESVLDNEEHDEDADGEAEGKPRKTRRDDGEDDDEPEDSDESDEDEDEDDDSDEDEDDDSDEDEDDEDDDDSELTEIDPEAKVTVKINGEDQEVTFKELQAGYSRTQDYTQKTQQVAEERRQLQAAKQEVVQAQNNWSQLLQQMNLRLQNGSLSNRTEQQWAELKATDEVAYYREREKDNQVHNQIRQIENEQARVQQANVDAYNEQLKETIAEEQGKLLMHVPDWGDPETLKKDVSAIKDYGKQVGFTDEEIDGLVDHRALLVLRDAQRYRALMESKDNGNGKGKARKRKSPVKPLKSGTRSTKGTKASSSRKAYDRLRKEKTVASATDYFEKLLDD